MVRVTLKMNYLFYAFHSFFREDLQFLIRHNKKKFELQMDFVRVADDTGIAVHHRKL